MRRPLLALAPLAACVALLGAAGDARAVGEPCDTADAGDCALSEYCSLADGGVILDGAPGFCLAEPCLASSDCLDPNLPICDTSQNPFACVQCISGADCPGILACDTATHTCVNPPPPPDASAPDGSAQDGGGEDASVADAAPDVVDASPPAHADASTDASATSDAGSVVATSPADQGSLGGGAWDCVLGATARTDAPLGAGAAALAVAALFLSRRRARRAK